MAISYGDPKLAGEINRELNNLLGMVRALDKRTAQSTASKSEIKDVGTPTAPASAVRLQDLQPILDRIIVLEGKNVAAKRAGRMAPPAPSDIGIRIPLGFVEAPDGARLIFTPDELVQLNGDGSPRGRLVRGRDLPIYTASNPPNPGEWTMNGERKVVFHETDPPAVNEVLEFAVAVVE